MLLDRAQRDALYQFVLTDLAGAGDVALALRAGEMCEAQRLRARFEEDLRLLDLLGWGGEGPERCELPLSAEASTALGRLRERARGLLEELAKQLLDDGLVDAVRVVETCATALEEESAAASARRGA